MLTYKLMVTAPALLTAILAVQARTSSDPFEMEGDWATSDRILQAYVPLMKECVQFNQREPSGIPMVESRKWAQRWIDGANSSRLLPMKSAQYGDTAEDGVKSQVFRANVHLAAALSYGYLTRRDYERAARDLVLAVQVLQVLKFSDMDCLAYCNIAQRRQIERLTLLMPKLGTDQRSEIAAQLSSIEKPTLVYYLAQKTRTQLATHLVWQGLDRQSLSRRSGAKVANLDAILQPSGDPVVVARALESSRSVNLANEEQTVLVAITFAYASQADLHHSLRKLDMSSKRIT